MSIVETSPFTATKASGAARRFIVSITDGVTVWLIGNFDGEMDNIRVLHLTDKFSFSQSVDNVEKTCSRATVTLQVVNLPYKNIGGVWTRFSDEISDIIGLYADKPTRIYVTANPNETSLANCLCIFNGIVRNMVTYTADTMTITLEDQGYLLDKILNTTKVRDVV